MPARNEKSQRDQRRRELLRAMLEEEEESVEPGFTEAELIALLRDLRHGRQPKGSLRGIMSSDQLQGFLLGVGAATILMMVLPSAKQSLRPLAVSAVKGAMDVVDRFKTVLGEAGEGLQDLVAEAQFERLKEAPGTGIQSSGQS